MSTFSRIAGATFIAPLSVIPVTFVVYPLMRLVSAARHFEPVSASEFVYEWFGMSVMFCVFGVIVAWIYLLIIGLPLYGVLRLFHLATPLPCALAGAVVGLVGVGGIGPDSGFFILTMSCGAAVAAAFSAYVNRGRA